MFRYGRWFLVTWRATGRACDKPRRSGILCAIVALSGVLASGCGSAVSNGLVDASSGADSSDASYAPCNDGRCGPNLVCEYPIADGCYAKGLCVPERGCGGAAKQPTYCGCDGGGVLGTCDLPGYVTGPVQSLFAIDGGSSWSAACMPCDAGGPCICSDAGSLCAEIAGP